MANQDRSAGEVKREDTGDRLAAATGADKQRQQVRLIRRRGAGAAKRRGKTPVAYQQP